MTGRVQSNIAVSERRNRLPIAKQSTSTPSQCLRVREGANAGVRAGESLLYLLEQHPVVILQSPTGTGKSTQIPQYLLEAGWAKEGKCIAITQPRRCGFFSFLIFGEPALTLDCTVQSRGDFRRTASSRRGRMRARRRGAFDLLLSHPCPLTLPLDRSATLSVSKRSRRQIRRSSTSRTACCSERSSSTRYFLATPS